MGYSNMKIKNQIIFLVILIPLLIYAGKGNVSENSLTWILPDSQEISPFVKPDYMQTAEGEKLVELINGGAVLFFKRGFERAVFQEYTVDSTAYINLEVYQMDKSVGAKGIFLDRLDSSAEQVALGNQGVRGNYFCSFYRDDYFIIVTGSDSSKTVQQLVFKTAEIIDKKIIGKNK